MNIFLVSDINDMINTSETNLFLLPSAQGSNTLGIVYGGLPSVKVSPSLPFKMEETYYTCLEHTFASANVKFGTSLCPKIIVISLFVSGQFWFSIYIYVSLRLRVQNAVPAQPCVGKY